MTLVLVAFPRGVNAQSYPTDVLITWAFENNKGWLAFGRGDYNTAERRFNAAIKTLRRHEAEDQRLLARSYYDLSLALHAQERYADAEPLAAWVLRVRERDPRTRADTLFDSIRLLADIHRELGRNAEAETLLRQALDIEERNTPPDDPGPAFTLMDIADVVVRQEKFEEADALLRRAIATLRHYGGDPSPALADALESRANVLDHLKRPEEARAAEAEARRIREDVREAAEPGAADPVKPATPSPPAPPRP